MKIIQVANSAIAALSRGADLYTVSKAHYIPGVTAAAKLPVGTDYAYYFVDSFAQGQAVFDLTAPIAGTTVSEVAVSPSFYPVSTKGAECGAIVTSLAWADKNLFEGYEFIWLVSGANPRYFVNGICNFTTNEAYNPFVQTEVLNAAAWDSSHAVNVNPFL